MPIETLDPPTLTRRAIYLLVEAQKADQAGANPAECAVHRLAQQAVEAAVEAGAMHTELHREARLHPDDRLRRHRTRGRNPHNGQRGPRRNHMTDVSIHDQQDPEGRPAAEEEIAGLLSGMTTADGTSMLDIYLATRDDE
ncbi:hypothetical protein [Streptomyces formicae]